MYALCYITRPRVHGPRAWSYKSNTVRVHACDIMNSCSNEAILLVLPCMLAKQVAGVCVALASAAGQVCYANMEVKYYRK